MGEPLDITEARREFGGSIVKTIMDKGWLSTKAVAIDRDPLDGRTFPYSEPLRLTVEQSEAATAIHGAFEEPSALGNTFLIEGVTGSGKTEVYLDAVDCCTQMGKQAIVLVPEIALTYPDNRALRVRFPTRSPFSTVVSRTASALTSGGKIKRGHYSIVIGSRSAIFCSRTRT